MKKQLSIGVLLLTVCGLVACQEGLPSSSRQETSFSSSNHGSNNVESSATSLISEPSSTTVESTVSDSSSSSSLIQSSNSSSKPNNYYPIGPTSEVDVFSKDITFALSTNVIDKDAAENLINNDFLPTSKEKAFTKMTGISSSKKESHVTINRTTATYSVKDLVEEKHIIAKIDSENKWYYSKQTEDTKTVYFVEGELNRHVIRESLYYVDNGCLYFVYAEKNYYEGMESKGTYEAYYTIMSDLTEEEYIGKFTIYPDSCTYFKESTGINKIDKVIYNNFTLSSCYYQAKNYSEMERHPNYEYHASGEKGNFGCVANDDCTYNFSDLNDYPSMEKEELNKIDYHQDFLLTISNYFEIEEDYLTRSISKSANKDKVIRDETIQGRKKTTEGCDIFYPDLSNFEEREYTPPITK